MDRDRGFPEFVAARSRALLRTAYLITGSETMAQDLVQEALAKTYVALPKLRDQGAVEGYARKAMAMTAISWWRRKPPASIPRRNFLTANTQIPLVPLINGSGSGRSCSDSRRGNASRSSCAITRT